MTKIADSECLQTGSRYTAFYYLLNPAGGAQNLVWTTNGSGTVWLVPISLHNVNQTTPFGEPGCSSSTVGQISGSVNVTSDAGGLVLDLIAKSSHVETVVPDAGQTLIQFTTTGTTQFRDSYKATSEAGITTMGWSWGNARGFALTALPVKPTLVTSSSPIAEPGPAAFVSGTGTTASVSCDAGTDTNRVLYAAIGQRTSAVSSVTYNGVPLTLVTSQTTLSTLGLYIYRLVAPPTGVNTLTVTLGSSSAEIALMCLPYSGVNQVTPDTFTGAIGTTMPATLTATGTTGGSLLGIVWAALGGSTTFTANQTGLSTQNNLYTNTRTLAAQFADANGTPKPLTWTATGAATSAWRETVVAINPAPAAPSGLRALRRPIMLQ
jgi:hypothetical protein